jgi:hypothetical protein
VFNAPLVDSSEFSLSFALDVNVFSEPVEVSIAVNLLFWVVFVPLFDEVKLLKSVLILPLSVSKKPTLFSIVIVVNPIEELKLEYPVVPVIITCAEPDITLSLLSLFLIVVSIDEVNEFKLLVDVCNVPITVSLLPV